MPEGRPLRSGDPDRIGAYRLTGFLGRGGQGAVYLGEGDDGQPVAIKVLDTEWAADPDYRRRFEREATAAQRVASFCTAKVLEVEVQAEQPYIVSEYVPGPTLRAEVQANGPRSGSELQRLAVATLTALVAMHEVGIVHRDFKPGNVLLAPDGARVIDFGVARVTDVTGGSSQSIIGTPGYMAPEQISGDTVDPAADVFAWGTVVLFAATGQSAFGGDSVPRVIHQTLHDDPDLSGLDEQWRGIVARCLSKDPNERPASSDLLLTLLGRADSAPAAAAAHTEEEPSPTGQESTDSRAVPSTGEQAAEPHGRRRRGRAIAIAAAVLLFVAAGAAGGYLVTSGDAGAAGAEQRTAGSPQSPSPDTERGGERAEPSALASAQTDTSPDDEDDDSEDDSEPDDDPSPTGTTFRDEFAGTWTGSERAADGGADDHQMVIESGSDTARLTTDGGPCTWTFTLVRENERGGYNATLTSIKGCGSHTTASMWFPNGDSDQLSIHLHGVPGNHEAMWFDMSRT